MKKITQMKLTKKLAKYSALSIALAGISDAAGQVVFTDVDPDFVGGAGESFGIDFNGDGTDEMSIDQTGNFTRANGTVIGLATNSYFYASNLASGTTISSGNTFQPYADLCYGGGYANSFCATGADGFIGVSFDLAGETHYGWVGLAAIDSGNFTVTGFAYESTPDTAILAGDDTLSLEDNTIEGLTSFVANNALTISATNPLENVTIHNINGQVVTSRELTNNTETVDLSALSTGMYIATVQTEGKVQTIKFVK